MKLRNLLFFCVFSCVCYAQNGDEEYHSSNEFTMPYDTTFFDFRMVLENYYMYYLEYPETGNQLIEYVKSIISAFRADNSFPAYFWFRWLDCNDYFIRYENDISIIQNDSILEVINNRNGQSGIIVKDWETHPCGIQLLLESEPVGYYGIFEKYRYPVDYYRLYEKYSRPLFFDIDNKAVTVENSLYSEFEPYFLELKKYLHKDSINYYYSESVGYRPIYITLEFRQGQKLVDFCDKQKPIPRLTYYIKLEEYLEAFCKFYNLSRIVFMSPDYLLSAEKTDD